MGLCRGRRENGFHPSKCVCKIEPSFCHDTPSLLRGFCSHRSSRNHIAFSELCKRFASEVTLARAGASR